MRSATIDLSFWRMRASASRPMGGVYGELFAGPRSVRPLLRVQDIITRIGETEDLHEAIALTPMRAPSFARLVAIRTRIKAAHTQPLSEEQLRHGSRTGSRAAIYGFHPGDIAMIRRLYRSPHYHRRDPRAGPQVLAGPVTAQGVPTVDTQNIAQEIRQLQQMLQDFGIQTDLLDNALGASSISCSSSSTSSKICMPR